MGTVPPGGYQESERISRTIMAEVRCRLLPFAVADGARNMATDETLLESAVAGVASLRLYGWSQATVSLGYFQPEMVRRTELLAPLPFVRRPSGQPIV